MNTMLIAAVASFIASTQSYPQGGYASHPEITQGPNHSNPTGLTRSAAEAQARAQFRSHDTNHDGFLTADEFGPSNSAVLTQLDTDHDGKASRDEVVTSLMAQFDAADTNHDHVLSDTERQASMHGGQ
ncbi:hypothetical protein GCM10023232_18620 [Sphingosinicella ginsenosidimutans]|nr:EF-hand domain-containing protein [Sphingosinicella ginsenosidimutans]